MLEFACDLSFLPHRIVANRRRSALRVQERVRTGRLGAHRRRLSAANIGSDHVNLGHGEYAVHDRGSLLFDHFVDGRVYIAHGNYFPRPGHGGVTPTHFVGFSTAILTFCAVFLLGPTDFYCPRTDLSPFLRCPQMLISMSRHCFRGP